MKHGGAAAAAAVAAAAVVVLRPPLSPPLYHLFSIAPYCLLSLLSERASFEWSELESGASY